MSAGQSLQKILYDTTRSSFPSGLFLLASSFPFKKKKKMIDSIISEIGVWKLHTSLSQVET